MASVPVALRAIRLGFQVGGRISPSFMGRYAEKLYFSTQRPREKPADAEVLAKAEAIELDQDGTKIAAWAWGKGAQTVLLMHGWSGRASQMVHFVEPLQKAGFRVIAFDAPAHGRSGGGSRTDMFKISKVMEKLRDREGKDFHAFITHSAGALTAAVATTGGMKVDKAVCISAAATLEGMITQFQAIVQAPPKVIAELRKRLDTFAGSDFWQRTHLDVPTLVIHDENDEMIPLSEAKRLADTWKKVEIVTTKGLGHRKILADPGVIERAVNFVKN